jgi:recombinational DNA repair protein (RecF pathway)
MSNIESINLLIRALRGDEKSPSPPQLVSPAQFLLDLVHTQEREQGCARKQTLIDLAKYILGSRDWSPAHTEIIKVLARYHLAKLANHHPLHRRQSWKLIAAEEAKPYVARCMRCGLPIWNKASVEAGRGPVCRRKVKAIERIDPAQHTNALLAQEGAEEIGQ